MKHDRLHNVAHNFATGLAGGLTFVVPNHVVGGNVFQQARASEGGFVVVDILAGKLVGSHAPGTLEHTASLLKGAFPVFCQKHGVNSSDYDAFLVRFSVTHVANTYVITIQDRSGRRTSREYAAVNGSRLKELDGLGRLRPKILAEPTD